jgi:uncharacterized membrane protein YdfJ with MMPL/SSD domain
LGELLDRHAKRDIDRTTLWAFAAVIVILLIIYRSPIAMFLPIVSIGLALLAALGAVGWAACGGLPVTSLVTMMVIVIMVGCGVDYCLFLFARFREELPRVGNIRTAVELAARFWRAPERTPSDWPRWDWRATATCIRPARRSRSRCASGPWPFLR